MENVKIKSSNFVMQHAGKLRDYYRIGKMLGSGAFGEVRVCVHRESNNQRAVKVLRKSHMDEDEKRMFFNEINVLKDLDHPDILKMYEFFEDEKRYYYVTPTSYLVLIQAFMLLLKEKRESIGSIINKYSKGIDQLADAKV